MKKQLIYLLIVLHPIFNISAFAETMEQWMPHILTIVKKYEGSSYTKATPDTDLQGFSLGLLQWTVKSKGSLDSLFATIGRPRAKKLATDRMPLFGKDFVEIIDLLQEGNRDEARVVSLRLQVLGQKDGVSYGKEFKASALTEIQAWLSEPDVIKAQNKMVENLTDDALKAVTRWKTRYSDSKQIEFSEFMFFFDAAVQGGLKGLSDDSLAESTNLVRDWQTYTPNNPALRERDLLNYLTSWLEVDWSTAGNPKYLRDAKKNASLLRQHRSELNIDEIQLLYMKYVRASVGNTPYQLPYLNRGVIDILGRGNVNSTFYDFTLIYKDRTPLDI